MDVARIRVQPHDEGDVPFLRFLFHADGGPTGIYVDVPVSDMVAFFKAGNTRMGIIAMAAHIQNAHESMLLIFDHPDDAVKAKVITAHDAEKIKAMKRVN